MPEVRIVGRGGAGAATASDDEYDTAVVISRPTLPWHDLRCKFEGGESWGVARSEWEAKWKASDDEYTNYFGKRPRIPFTPIEDRIIQLGLGMIGLRLGGDAPVRSRHYRDVSDFFADFTLVFAVNARSVTHVRDRIKVLGKPGPHYNTEMMSTAAQAFMKYQLIYKAFWNQNVDRWFKEILVLPVPTDECPEAVDDADTTDEWEASRRAYIRKHFAPQMHGLAFLVKSFLEFSKTGKGAGNVDEIVGDDNEDATMIRDGEAPRGGAQAGASNVAEKHTGTKRPRYATTAEAPPGGWKPDPTYTDE